MKGNELEIWMTSLPHGTLSQYRVTVECWFNNQCQWSRGQLERLYNAISDKTKLEFNLLCYNDKPGGLSVQLPPPGKLAAQLKSYFDDSCLVCNTRFQLLQNRAVCHTRFQSLQNHVVCHTRSPLLQNWVLTHVLRSLQTMRWHQHARCSTISSNHKRAVIFQLRNYNKPRWTAEKTFSRTPITGGVLY